MEEVKKITGRGFKRSGHADNKRAIAALIKDKKAYLDDIRKHLDSVEHAEYMGYVLGERVSLRVFNAVNAAIDVLENVSPNNARIFMTAVVVTSYVYNNMIHHVDSMRPVDDYDIMRWYLLFATIKNFNIDPTAIKTVHKNEKEYLSFQNVSLHLPKVNNKSLATAEALELLRNTPLLEKHDPSAGRALI